MRQEVVGDVEFAAEALEHENDIGEDGAHPGGDAFPGGGRDLVAGVAAEAVGAPGAPEEEDLGHGVGHFGAGEVEFDQVLPGDAPGARREEFAGWGAAEPFRVVGLESGGPAGVVGGDVKEKACAAGVDGVGQFGELVEGGGGLVELGEGGIDVEVVAAGER